MTANSQVGSYPLGPYKNYFGEAEYDAEAGRFHGQVKGKRDVITFQGTTIGELTDAFRESIDDYLQFCKEREERPE